MGCDAVLKSVPVFSQGDFRSPSGMAKPKTLCIFHTVRIKAQPHKVIESISRRSAVLGRDPAKPRRVTRLLKRQRGHCAHCELRFTTDDVLEVHHHDRNHQNNAFDNLRLLHGHCHDVACPERSVGFTVNGADDHSPYSEEPDKAKVLRPVREWRQGQRWPCRP